MSRYDLRPAAEADLKQIWRYSVENWGEDRAERYITDLRMAIERAAEAPLSGQQMKIGARLYYFRRAASHRIFYRETRGGIEVLRVLHAQMDFARHLT
jgi:toxin ParE1/3/4